MKNLNLPISSSDDPSNGLHFEVESAEAAAVADGTDSKISYGLNIRQSTKFDTGEDRKGEGDKLELEEHNGEKKRTSSRPDDVLLQKLKYDMTRLPDDRGMEEFEDMPVEGFAKALLAGYGWSEGMGIGKNAKEDVKVVEYHKRTDKHGLGFVSDDLPGKKSDSDLDLNKDKEKEKGKERVREVEREDEVKALKGKQVRIIGGRDVGLRGMIVEKLEHGGFVLKLSKSGDLVKVSVDDLAELGSKEEARCLKRLKELKIQEESEGKVNKGNRQQSSWLTGQIRVRIISKEFKRGRLYRQKGKVVDVVGPRMCDISMDDSRELIQGVSEDLLETAVPQRGGPVLVLSGKHKGVYGKLMERDSARETAVVQDADTHTLLKVHLDEIAEYIGDPSLLNY